MNILKTGGAADKVGEDPKEIPVSEREVECVKRLTDSPLAFTEYQRRNSRRGVRRKKKLIQIEQRGDRS